MVKEKDRSPLMLGSVLVKMISLTANWRSAYAISVAGATGSSVSLPSSVFQLVEIVGCVPVNSNRSFGFEYP